MDTNLNKGLQNLWFPNLDYFWYCMNQYSETTQISTSVITTWEDSLHSMI